MLATIILATNSLSFAQGEKEEFRYNVIEVPYISQLHPMKAVVGCEGTSILMGLKAKGVATDISLKKFLDDMPKHSSNPAKGFVGSPYRTSETLRTTIYPKPLADYANTYMDKIARDISGADLEQIKDEIINGNPVVIYATMWWNKPFYKQFNIEGENQWLLRNNHVVLLTGYDEKANKFYVADPYNKSNPKNKYFYWIEESKLKPIYNERKWAVAVGEIKEIEEIEEIQEIQEIQQGNETFGKNLYNGIIINDKIYFDIADILKKELNSEFNYIHDFRSAYINSNKTNLIINFINNSVYLNNNMIDSITGDRIIKDDKYYFEEMDIRKIINLLTIQ